jgi:uncharacterized protein YdbL (DUF1318 family)
MKVKRWSGFVLSLAFLVGCVTINVYFPAAAAQEAADRIIQDVYGEAPARPSDGEKSPPASQTSPQSSLQHAGEVVLTRVLDFWIPPAYAGADINIQTPAIQRLQTSLRQRHEQLAKYYASGAVGMTGDGFIKIRDLNAIALPDRRPVQQLVSSENVDRAALYEEIARANGHPEWKADIQATFAKGWVSNAPAGWWYQDGQGQWVKK